MLTRYHIFFPENFTHCSVSSIDSKRIQKYCFDFCLLFCGNKRSAIISFYSNEKFMAITPFLCSHIQELTFRIILMRLQIRFWLPLLSLGLLSAKFKILYILMRLRLQQKRNDAPPCGFCSATLGNSLQYLFCYLRTYLNIKFIPRK
jgi:hypothetical protein